MITFTAIFSSNFRVINYSSGFVDKNAESLSETNEARQKQSVMMSQVTSSIQSEMLLLIY